MSNLRLVQWFGGKGNMVAKLLPLIPKTPVYVEAYGGAASILLNKPPAPCEVYNDLDGLLVNLFRVMQNPSQYRRLRYRLDNTLYSVDEFDLAVSIVKSPEGHDPVTLAWAFYVGQNQGMSGINCRTSGRSSWSRAFVSRRGMATTASRWQSGIARLDAIRERMKRVQIDSRDALDFIRYWDSKETCLYLDPPYIADTRKSGEYEHEIDDDHHRKLVETILGCVGVVVLSGYDHPIYQPLTDAGWSKFVFRTATSSAARTRNSGLQGAGGALRGAARTEVVWRNRNRGQLKMEV